MNSVNLNCLVNRVFLPSNKERSDTIFLSVELTPIETPQKERLQSMVAIVIDKSGSMAEGRKIDTAKEAAIQFLSSLDESDYVVIITFSDKVDTIFSGYIGESQSRGGLFGKDSIKSAIQKIRIGGGTNLYGAIEETFDKLSSALEEGINFAKKVLVLSDGMPNIGPENPSEFASLAGKMSEIGVSITSAGIGGNYNEDVLLALAEHSQGKFKHITHPNEIIDLFMKESTRMKSTTMIQPKIRIKPSAGTELGRVYKAKPEAYECKNVKFTGNEYQVSISDLIANESQTYIVELHVPPREEGVFRVARVDVEGNGGEDIVITYTSDPDLYNKENSFARELFFLTEYKTKLKSALSGDQTLVRDINETLLNYINDPSLQRDVTQVRDLARKAKSGLTPEETKVAKEELTQFRGGEK